MKTFNILLFILSLVFLDSVSASSSSADTSSSADEENEFETGVIKLTSRNFESEISDGSVWLVEFYADWCGHCQRFAPTYTSIAHSLHAENKSKPKDKRIKVGKVDGSKERILTSRFSIRAFPSFFVVDGWDVYEYENTRSKEAIINYVKRDYKKDEPMQFFNSPFGPIGQTRAAVMKVGSFVLDYYEDLTEVKKFSPVIATMLLAGAGIIVGTFITLFFGLLLMSKQKVD